MRNRSRVVIIVPCYNEEESLPQLVSQLQNLRTQLSAKYSLDLLFVNDGSTDRTQDLIDVLAAQNDYVFYRQFAYNAGHQSAIRAGIDVAQDYDAVVMMDADSQHPPKLVPQMLEAWEAGAKIVQMVRRDNLKNAGIVKYFTSQGYYSLINHISDLRLERGASDFRLIDSSISAMVARSTEKDLFLRGYFSWLPVKQHSIAYDPNKRIAGSSKYTMRKMFDLAYSGVLQFSEKPLTIATTFGSLLAFLSFAYGAILIIEYLLHDHFISGWTSLMVVMLFCFGINFILLGIIGSYLAHSIRIQKQRPQFVIAGQKLPLANEYSIKMAKLPDSLT